MHPSGGQLAEESEEGEARIIIIILIMITMIIIRIFWPSAHPATVPGLRGRGALETCRVFLGTLSRVSRGVSVLHVGEEDDD